MLAGQFYLYTALTRSKPFTEVVARSSAQEGVNIVVGSLMRTMVVSVAALFDRDERTSNLPKLIKRSLQPGSVAQLERFHAHYGVRLEAEMSRLRLVKYQRKLKTGRIRQAADRLMHVRQTHVAHFDADPTPRTDAEKAIVRDLDRVVIGVGIIVAETNVFVLGRRVDFPELRKVLRHQAGDFCGLLFTGASTPGTGER